MATLLTVLLVLVFSMLVTRLASTALTLTGMSSEAARFQARSAFTGAGFTTSESESVVTHPVRRRIIMLLMVAGRAGVVGAVSTLTLSFAGAEGAADALPRLVVLVLGIVALWLFAQSRVVDRQLERLITWALARYADMDTRDYAALLHFSEDYAVLEMQVPEGSWSAGRTLRWLNLRDEGIAVLGIERRDGGWRGAPTSDTCIEAGDVVVLYGRQSRLHELDRRPAGPEGDRRHAEAVAEQQAVVATEEQREAEGAPPDGAGGLGQHA